MPHTIDTIRDLINEPAIRGALLRDSDRWHRVCTAMDYLSAGGHAPDRVDAINVLATEADETPLPPGSDEVAIREAMQRVGNGLDRRHRRQRKAFAARPLENAFTSFTDLGYAIEKVAGVTRSPSDRAVAAAYLDPLEELIIATRDGLNERGLYGDDLTSDLERILKRVRAYVGGEPDAPTDEDLDLIVRHALRKLLDELRTSAHEVDTDDRRF